MKLLLACFVSLACVACRAEIPQLFTQKTFTSASLAEAVNHYVALGEAESLKEFDGLAAQERAESHLFGGKGFSVTERIGWVCRILYLPKQKSALRAPKFGVLPLPGKSFTEENWPLYPVALSGSTYFVLREGYQPKGAPETIGHYLDYCHDQGVFRTTPVEIPAREEARQDAANLRKSPPWQAIQWTGNEIFNFPMGGSMIFSYIENQARTIPVPENTAEHDAKRKPDSPSVSMR